MIGFPLRTVEPELITDTHLVSSVVSFPARVPSFDRAAKADIDRMLNDDDVKRLPAEVWLTVQAFATELMRWFYLSGSSRIAIFGDEEESTGEVTLVDQESRRQVTLTVRADNADVWMGGESTTYTREGVRPEQLRSISEIYFQLG